MTRSTEPSVEEVSAMEREPWMDWNPRFRDPDEETLKKMKKSVEDFEKAQTRDVMCPVCHGRLGTVQAERSGFLKTKCQNCKSTVPLDLRLFRKQKQRRNIACSNRRERCVR